jgi:hypothetical protein
MGVSVICDAERRGGFSSGLGVTAIVSGDGAETVANKAFIRINAQGIVVRVSAWEL